jgi:hypothetical protein
LQLLYDALESGPFQRSSFIRLSSPVLLLSKNRPVEALRLMRAPITLPVNQYTRKSLITDSLAGIWVILNIYGILCDLTTPPAPTFAGIIALLTLLVVAWSALERKRWGRLALLGIAAIKCIDIATALICLLALGHLGLDVHMHGVWCPLLVHSSHYGDMSEAVAIRTLLGCGMLTVVTLLWLLHPDVKSEFNSRKQFRTSRTQLAIAIFLVMVWACGQLLAGVTHSVEESLSPSWHQIIAKP